MKIRTFSVVLITALFSSIFSVALYKYLEGPQQVIVKEVAAPKYANNTTNDIDWDALLSERMAKNFSSSAPTNFIDAAKKVTPAVVNISTRGGSLDFWGSFSGSSGSGVIFSPDGYIVTNNHVIEDGKNNIEVTLYNGHEYKAKLIGTDPTTDIAVLKIEPEESLPFLLFGNSDSVSIGEWVLAVGNPFNLASTVTAGIVSAKGRDIDILEGEYKIESFLQTDAAVNPGNSGGALVNTNGELIGINTAIITQSGRYEGYSFAIPANLAKKVVRDLKEFGQVQRAILGIRIAEVSAERANVLKLDAPEGVYIQSVSANSAAEDAGLRSGDVIIGIDGKKTKTIPQLQEYVALFRPGSTVDVTFMRDGRKRDVRVTLKNIDNEVSVTTIDRNDDLMDGLGFELRDMTNGEKRATGQSAGAVVENIQRNSIIHSTNMDPGFIITKVNELEAVPGRDYRKITQYDIKSADDVAYALSNIKTGVVLLEGVYEKHSGEWGYQFEMDR